MFGTGVEHPVQLFNLLSDPDETKNLAESDPSTVARLDALLRTVIDYPSVAKDVSEYNHASLSMWVNRTRNWKTIVANQRWKASFDVDTNASIAAIQAYVSASPQILKCRGSPIWPPQ